MGTYGLVQIVAAEARDDLALQIDGYIAEQFVAKAKDQGLHPIGEPRLEWHRLTEMDIVEDLGMQRAAGITDPAVHYRAGDWRVLGRVTVQEDPPG